MKVALPEAQGAYLPKWVRKRGILLLILLGVLGMGWGLKEGLGLLSKIPPLLALLLAVPLGLGAGILHAAFSLRGAQATERQLSTFRLWLDGAFRQLWVARLPAHRRAIHWADWALRSPYLNQALEYLERAAGLGHAEAHFELGLYHLEAGLMGEGGSLAAEHFRQAAEQGHAEAAYRLAELLRWGQGVSRDGKAAHRWCLRAAQGGFAPAMARLVEAYRAGEGTELDLERGGRWAEKLASLQAPQGLRKSALRASNSGEGRRAQQLRDAFGEGLEGIGYWRGWRPITRLVAGFGLFLALGIVALWALVSNLPIVGPLVFLAGGIPLAFLVVLAWRPRRERLSLRHGRLLARAQGGDPEACFRFGEAYLRGSFETPKDAVAARVWFEKAAQAGHGDAMVRLAELLEWGLAGCKDTTQAEAWLRRAAQAGHSGALARLQESRPSEAPSRDALASQERAEPEAAAEPVSSSPTAQEDS